MGVPLGAGVEDEEGARSSQDMTSSAFPPAGMSRATWLPLFFPEPTSVAKSTSPDADKLPNDGPAPADDPAT